MQEKKTAFDAGHKQLPGSFRMCRMNVGKKPFRRRFWKMPSSKKTKGELKQAEIRNEQAQVLKDKRTAGAEKAHQDAQGQFAGKQIVCSGRSDRLKNTQREEEKAADGLMPEGWAESMLRGQTRRESARHGGVRKNGKSRLRRIRKNEKEIGRFWRKIENDEKIQKTKQTDCRVKAQERRENTRAYSSKSKKKRGLSYGTATKGKRGDSTKAEGQKQLEDAIEDAGKNIRRRKRADRRSSEHQPAER